MRCLRERGLALALGGLLLMSALSGCRTEGRPTTGGTAAATAEPSTLFGVSLSPRSFEAADFNAFLALAGEAGTIITWAGDWAELGRPDGGPYTVTGLAVGQAHPFVPVIELQVFAQSTGELLRPLDAATAQQYTDEAVSFVTKAKPHYLGVGVEVNVLHERSPADFEAFVALFNSTCDAVKATSPETRVFTVFQLEKLKGLNGGLFGGVNDSAKSEWRLLDRLAKADLFAFTTYPGLIFKSPADMPADYYSEIRQHTDKPLAFSEIGWQGESVSADWPSNDTVQADFVRRFFAMTSGALPEFFVWTFLYDQETIRPFDSMGFFRRDGTPRPAWDAWLQAN